MSWTPICDPVDNEIRLVGVIAPVHLCKGPMYDPTGFVFVEVIGLDMSSLFSLVYGADL